MRYIGLVIVEETEDTGTGKLTLSFFFVLLVLLLGISFRYRRGREGKFTIQVLHTIYHHQYCHRQER